MLGIVLLIGLVSGVVLVAAAGARRTSTAYPRLLRWASAVQLDLVPGPFVLLAGLAAGWVAAGIVVAALPADAAVCSRPAVILRGEWPQAVRPRCLLAEGVPTTTGDLHACPLAVSGPV